MEITQNGKKIVYVSQDNYLIVDPGSSRNTVYYCDSATSCVILVAAGYSSRLSKDVAVISHLSRPGRFEDYFSKVEESFGTEDAVSVYASGANPPQRYHKKDGSEDATALRNAKQVIEWAASGRIKLEQLSLKLGQGNPAIYDNDLDCYSLKFDEDGDMCVTNDRLYLTQEQRDPTGGIQTLFCMYGNQDKIRDQYAEFSDAEIVSYVEAARAAGLEGAAGMSDEEILQNYSSTPEYEVPWFCDSIRQAAFFVKSYQA